MFTLACLWVRGHVPFGVEYVQRLKSMVDQRTEEPFNMVCFTDRPGEVPEGIEAIMIRPIPGAKAWWNKIQLFNPSLRLRGRVVYLDLDVVVVKSLEPIVERKEPFTLIPHAGDFNGKDGLAVVKKFNSSVMSWLANCREADTIFHKWKPHVMQRLWGDQDHIGEVLPDLPTMPLEWFPRLSEGGPPWSACAKVVLCKKPKNHDAVKWVPGFADWWK